MRGTHLGPTCTQTSPLPVCTEATLPNSTGTATHLQPTIFNNIPQERAVRGKHLVFLALNLHLYQSARKPRYQTLRGQLTYFLPFLILCAQERPVRGTHLGLSCTQLVHLPRYQTLRGATHLQPLLFNIVRSRTSSARDTFRSLLHSTHTSTSLHGGHVTKPILFNNMAQERAVRGTQLGLPCTQPAPLPVCTEATLPNPTGGCYPDEGPSRNIWHRGRWRNLHQTGRGHNTKLYRGANLKKAA